jgi:hypothetical protein
MSSRLDQSRAGILLAPGWQKGCVFLCLCPGWPGHSPHSTLGARVSDALCGLSCWPVSGRPPAAFCMTDGCPRARLGMCRASRWTNGFWACCLAAKYAATGSEGGKRKWPAGQLSSLARPESGPSRRSWAALGGTRRVMYSRLFSTNHEKVASRLLAGFCTWLARLDRSHSRPAALGAMSHRIHSDQCLDDVSDQGSVNVENDAMHVEIAVYICAGVNGELRAVAIPHPPKCSPRPHLIPTQLEHRRRCRRPNAAMALSRGGRLATARRFGCSTAL